MEQPATAPGTPPPVADPETPLVAAVEHQALESKAAQGGRWVGVGAFVSNLTASLVLLALAAALSPEDLGILALGQMVFVLCNTLQDFGLWDVLVYYRGAAKRAAEAVLLCWLVSSLLLASLIVGTSPFIAAFFGEPRATPVIAVAGVLLVLHAVAGVPLAMRTRSLDLRHRAQVQMTGVVVGGLVTVCLLVAGLGIAAMVIGQVVQGVVLVALAWGAGPRMRPRWHGPVVREMLGYGRHAFGASLFTIVQYNVDYLLVGRILGAASLGVYSLGFRVAFVPYAVVTVVVSSTMFALVCRIERAQHAEVTLRYTRLMLLLVTPLATGLAVFAPAVTLLGDQWLPAVPVLRVLGGYVLLASAASIAEVGLKALGRPQRAFASATLHVVLLVLLLVVLAERGVVAVAGVRAGVAAAVAVVAWTWLTRQLGVSALRLVVLAWIPAVGAGVMLAVAWMVGWSMTESDGLRWVPTLLRGAAALAAYAAVVLALDARARAATLQRLAPGRRRSRRAGR